MAERTPPEMPSLMGAGHFIEKDIEDESTPGRPEETSAQTPASTSASLRALTDKALDFLAHASNEALGACFLGLGATTYLVLGRVGLIIIGVAGGVVLHATWDGARGSSLDGESRRLLQERRRETGVEVAKRILDVRQLAEGEGDVGDTKVFASQNNLDFASFGPEAATAMETFTQAIIKDYVYYWYRPTLPGEESFPASCKRTLTAFLLSLCGHLRQKRPADAFLDFVTNTSSIIIVFLNELAAALNASPNTPPEAAIATYLKLKPESSLSYLLDEKSQSRKLNDISEDLLQAYLDPKSYNCAPVHVFLKQVLTQLVLGYTITLCSKPEWINDWILYGLEESETAKEVMEMVDASVEGRPVEDSVKIGVEAAETSAVTNRKQTSAAVDPTKKPAGEHKRQMSRAEEAMDDAMNEAKRLTQLMIKEDEKRAKEEQEQQAAEDVSDSATIGTPTSSQSDKDRRDEEPSTWSKHTSITLDSPTSADLTKPAPSSAQFTSFDQLLPSQQPAALAESPARSPQRQSMALTLHNATISIFDDSVPGERTSIKAKPATDYLVQIEPSNTSFTGWMIARKYADFETLHEVLRRISVVTGVPQFVTAHAELPKWKVHTKASLREELERYLTDAMRFQSLAESEGMKRFLEKERGLNKSPSERKGFGWPTPDAFGKLGGDMMNVLTKAPKQVAGSGKSVFGGVAGLVGAQGKRTGSSRPDLNRLSTSSSLEGGAHQRGLSTSQSFVADSYSGSTNSPSARQSEEGVRQLPQDALERKASIATMSSSDLKPRPSVPSQRPSVDLARLEESTDNGLIPSPQGKAKSLQPVQQPINLPPPPSEISDDFGSPTQRGRKSTDTFRSSQTDSRVSISMDGVVNVTPPQQAPRPAHVPAKSEAKPKSPLTERETSVAIELMFAVITELYTLSGAWQIRRTLLTAAKTFLLRPGNPQLTTIRDMLQQSLLDENLSDAGIAALVYKLRENALPTEDELAKWKKEYPEKSEEQNEQVRIKARKLLVTKGMPQALTSVMGAAASGEALGKVFDCLQMPAVSRGLIFGLLLQVMRVMTH